jgi:ferredoxin-NADP reductase
MMRWLDRVTGRVTMYRLVLICLLALLVEALLVSLTGQLFYNPLAILACGALAVVVSYLSNRLFALLFRVKPHSESALITGLILLMLFPPLFDGLQFLAIGLAALLATASKYVLAIRRRHIFNPAAVGALIVGFILPTNAPGWWVATPWLLPLVAVASFVILYRTRRLAMGIVFVVVSALAVTIITLAVSPTTFVGALGTAFESYPIVFLAGFMLSEPLTLPPRRWQQLAEAAIVALLFGLMALGFHLGPVYASPQLALLVGNLLAFLVGQRRGIRLDYLGREQLTSTSWELSFRPRRDVRFAAGQYMELTLPHSGVDVRGLRRTFSIASAPGGDEVRFGIRVAERSSSFKTALLALRPGETITATAVGGDFVLPKDPATPVLLVAGGIGITPYVSHLAAIEAAAAKRDVVLVYASSSADDLAYAERLQTHGQRVFLVAPEPPEVLPSSWTYLGAGPLTAELLLPAVPDVRQRAAYVSGPPALVRSLTPALRRAGVRRVRTDYFSGY